MKPVFLKPLYSTGFFKNRRRIKIILNESIFNNDIKWMALEAKMYCLYLYKNSKLLTTSESNNSQSSITKT